MEGGGEDEEKGGSRREEGWKVRMRGSVVEEECEKGGGW